MKCCICDEECQELYDTLLSKPPPPWSHVIVHPTRGEIDTWRNFNGSGTSDISGRFAVFKQYKILKRNEISSGVTEYIRGEKVQVVGKKLYDICHHCTWYSGNQLFRTDERLYLNLITKGKNYWNFDLNRLKANKKEWKKMVIKNVRRSIEPILAEFDSVQSEIHSKLLKVKKLDYDSLLVLDSLGEIYSFISDINYSLPYRKKWIDFYISIGFLQGVEDRLHGEVFMLGENFKLI